MPRRRHAYIALVASCAAVAVAQDTTVKCTYADWTTNARGQSPCLVWAELQTKCDAGGVRVTPLANGRFHYTEPDEPHEINDCNCSVVAYNLMAACTWCQLGLADKWVNETLWRSNCPSYNARGLSIDTSDLTIPSWSTIPVDGGMWRPNIASLAASPPTVSPTSGSQTTQFSPQTTADSGTHHNESHGGNAGAIAGGVVGAALIVLLFAALFVFFIRRSKRRAEIEARLRASRRDRSGRNSSRPRSTAGTGAGVGEKRNSRSVPSTEKPQAESPAMPTVPDMAYHPRCNHGIASLAAASPRASTSTAAPTATEDGRRTPPKSADHMV